MKLPTVHSGFTGTGCVSWDSQEGFLLINGVQLELREHDEDKGRESPERIAQNVGSFFLPVLDPPCKSTCFINKKASCDAKGSHTEDGNSVVGDLPPLVGSLLLGLHHVAVKPWLLLQGNLDTTLIFMLKSVKTTKSGSIILW